MTVACRAYNKEVFKGLFGTDIIMYFLATLFISEIASIKYPFLSVQEFPNMLQDQSSLL